MYMKSVLAQIALVIFFFGSSHFGHAQLITQVASPNWILPNLFGPDYLVSNIQQTGHWEAFGYFDGTASNLGLSAGLVLTTGKVIGSNGPCGPNNFGATGLDNNQPGFTPLSNLVGGTTTYNAAVLEFDLTVFADSIKIPFVFGSEEYPEYVGAAFNDVIAIFLSGPGIPGLQNIARLPSGAATSIDNVHGSVVNTFGTFPAVNPVYYVDNITGVSASDSTKIQYDGFTVPIMAIGDVQFGGLYHLTIAIADAGDGIVDSGLFIGKCASCTLTAGLSDVEQAFFEVFPNPSNSDVTLRSSVDAEFDIMDAAGRVVLHGSLVPGTEQLVSGLGSGTYYANFYSDELKLVKKLVVL